MFANLPEWRRDGQRQSSVDFFRGHEGNVRCTTSLAFPSEGDADAAKPQPARPRGRRVPPRPNELVLQETYHRDEHRQRLPFIRTARCHRQSVKRLRQRRPAFYKSGCGLFGSDLTAAGLKDSVAMPDCAPLIAVRPRRGGWTAHPASWVGWQKQRTAFRADKGRRQTEVSRLLMAPSAQSRLFDTNRQIEVDQQQVSADQNWLGKLPVMISGGLQSLLLIDFNSLIGEPEIKSQNNNFLSKVAYTHAKVTRCKGEHYKSSGKNSCRLVICI